MTFELGIKNENPGALIALQADSPVAPPCPGIPPAGPRTLA